MQIICNFFIEFYYASKHFSVKHNLSLMKFIHNHITGLKSSKTIRTNVYFPSITSVYRFMFYMYKRSTHFICYKYTTVLKHMHM